jgi:hypothetical protein
MIDRDAIHGGFNNSLRSQMSEGLQRRLAEQEAAEAREAAQEQREQRMRAEAHQESAIQAAIAMELERGEAFHPRWLRGEKLGHTPSEFIALRAEQMDVEDAQREARVRAAHRKLQAQLEQQEYGDLTAPTPEEMASRAERDERHREARIQGSVRRFERAKTVKEARAAALHDAIGLVVAAERYR